VVLNTLGRAVQGTWDLGKEELGSRHLYQRGIGGGTETKQTNRNRRTLARKDSSYRRKKKEEGKRERISKGKTGKKVISESHARGAPNIKILDHRKKKNTGTGMGTEEKKGF